MNYVVKNTDNAPEKSKLEKEINSIFKKFKSRLIALDKKPNKIYKDCYKVHTINDLVKISDEIERPIMYKYSKNLKEITEFIVVDDSALYMYEIISKEIGKKYQS